VAQRVAPAVVRQQARRLRFPIRPRPNPRMQRTPSAPLMRKPLGRVTSNTLLVVAVTVACSRTTQGFVDRRLDKETYFVQRVSKAAIRDTEAERQEGRELTCHLATLTLSAGFDSFEVIPSTRGPDLHAREGESVSMATIHMRAGHPTLEEHSRMDARLVRKQLCGGG